jgi:hypothetical protein
LIFASRRYFVIELGSLNKSCWRGEAETIVVAKTAPATWCSIDHNVEFIFHEVVLVGKIDGYELGSDEYGLWDVVWIFCLPIHWPVAEVMDKSL